MKWVVDRFEGDQAVLEEISVTPHAARQNTAVARDRLPAGTREGDVLLQEGETFFVDRDATEKRAEAIRARFDRLKRRQRRHI